MNIVQQIVERTRKDGGCTYGLLEGRFVEAGEPFYSMSLDKNLEAIIVNHRFDEMEMRGYIENNIDRLLMGGHAVGTWMYEGRVYLDVVYLFKKDLYNELDLIEFASDQIAAWDFEFSKEIKL
jgi:hypothetical protein